MDAEKNILCFGDSNTWGADPAGGARFDRNTRWPCILQKELGNGYHVIEEGLCGRTTVWDDPIELDKNGYKHLYTALKTHMPLDLVIIMLGTNDLKYRFSVSAFDIAESAGRLVQSVREVTWPPFFPTPEVLVICPPPTAALEPTPFKDIFQGGEEKSHQLAAHFKAVGKTLNFHTLNAADIIQSSPLDGIHFEASEHRKLGRAVAEEARKLI